MQGFDLRVSKNKTGWIPVEDIRILPNPKTIQTCEQILKALPPIRGIKLEQTVSQVRNAFGGFNSTLELYFKRKTYIAPALPELVEYKYFSIPLTDIPIEHKENLVAVDVIFTLDRVAEFQVYYDKSIIWINPAEFFMKLSEIYNLPAELWESNRLRCGDYQMTVEVFPNAELVGSKLSVSKSDWLIQKELQAERQRLQKTFKP